MSIKGRVERLMEFVEAWLVIEETGETELRRVCEIHGWNYTDVYKYWRNSLHCRSVIDIEVRTGLVSEFGFGKIRERAEELRRKASDVSSNGLDGSCDE